MKKYYVSDLYVVEVPGDNDFHYLICKRDNKDNTYIEIFTKEKIKVLDNLSVEKLSSYYTTEENILLDEKELLRKYATINELEHVQNNNDIEINKILENAVLEFFPKNGAWYSNCFDRPKYLSMTNLPCHLRDDLWLAKMLRRNKKLFQISVNTILQFIKTSSIFQEKRHEYELEIVKWQINWMRNNGDNWVVDEEYGGDFVLYTPACDLGFRKGIVDTLLKIGVNKDAIEEGIEKNIDMWRDALMNRAFQNEYEPVLIMDFKGYFENVEQPKEERKILEPVDLEFKENWLRMRKYEYYQRHKDSVDKYGVVETDMKLTEEEVAKLLEYLGRKHNERKLQIEQYEQEISASNGQQRVLIK